MNKKTYNLNEAVDVFLKAFYDYEIASRKMQHSLQRLSRDNQAFRDSLKIIIDASGAMITPRRIDPQRL